ncbi:MAG: HsdR family type I site-specific deoxyribonuclease [Candidatus Omnitrophica bacterium]|nr:HsdR family type I site-specific deoxyribonuclease [Candidatus Omnitrophota bacterium]MBU4457928.1 HsdR family type I site-specific deoxyribonuclease [Candidatus Omnitrophota bacterium]
MDTPSFKEDHISQVPALQLLINLGYTYLTPEEALIARGGKTSNVILETILEKQLCQINTILYKGGEYKFSNNNITNAINTLKNIPYDGLIRTNEKIYDLLSLGKSFEETILGNTKSFDLKFIDWENLDRNVLHVTEEFEVMQSDGKAHRRPDLVLFVNGIPFAVIECKCPDIKDPIKEAISQNLRNQTDEFIPELFVYSQVLMAVSKNEAKYGTAGTADKFWAAWKEKEDFEAEVKRLVNKPLSLEIKDKLFASRFQYVRRYFDAIESEERLVTSQDRAIYSLLKSDRLLKLSRQFVIYDCGEKKIARHQQYFAVKNTIERVSQYQDSKRKGGVIWHTQGSGKSITMVMLAKALALCPSIPNPRIVIVTDRIDLDQQICDTFKHCGMEPEKAKTGAHLMEILDKNKKTIVTSVLDKFQAGLNKRSVEVTSENIFVLVDESHRSQYGIAHALMKKVLPNACYIGFTGTPLLKSEKSTAEKFGGFIQPIYTINDAVEDKAVVPLLYEGRHVLQDVDQKPIDTWFTRVCEPLSEYQVTDLKRKFSKIEKLNLTDQKIYMISYDVSEHFRKNWQGTGFKAQIATDSKAAALKFKKCLDEINKVSSEVVISAPDKRKGYEDIYEEPTEEVLKFWKNMLKRFSSESEYNKQVIASFKHAEQPEILIVVEKLLTGFDAHRNTVLYIAKSMKEHTLLQAIARVNRIHEGKDYGFIVDYYGILGELDLALTAYEELSGFDKEDLEGTLVNIAEEVKTLPQKYADLWDIFKEIKNRRDEEEYERFLFDEELRHKFYEKLTAFSKTLSIALSSEKFYEEVTEKQINKYKDDFKFFQKLRVSVKKRYAEVVDFKEYEDKIQKLLNTYVSSDEVIKITDPVNIFDKENFQKEVTKAVGEAAKADMIAHRTKRTIEEKYDEDPVFYEKFSNLLKKAIDDYRQARITDAQYFLTANEIMEAVRDRKDTDMPDILQDKDVAKAFYGVVYESVNQRNNDKGASAKIAIDIDAIIQRNIVVDWHLKTDIQNKMLNDIEDYLADETKLGLSYEEIDLIMEKIINIAKRRYAK